MITVRSILGNTRSERKFRELFEIFQRENKVERVLLSRMEAQRSRIRRTSDRGTDVAISLDNGFSLKHGDVLLVEENRLILVEYEPEDVLGFKIIGKLPFEQKIAVAIKLGHIIGNLHKPLSTKGEMVYVPLQSEAEVETLKKNLTPVIQFLDINHARMVFEPDEAINLHIH